MSHVQTNRYSIRKVLQIVRTTMSNFTIEAFMGLYYNRHVVKIVWSIRY